jgi:hypothetical protein
MAEVYAAALSAELVVVVVLTDSETVALVTEPFAFETITS